jgi:CDP-paratose 2-epimerase
MPFHSAPRVPAVYNLGGGRFNNCSMLEAIDLCEQIAARRLDWSLSDTARIGDHRWWISDLLRGGRSPEEGGLRE